MTPEIMNANRHSFNHIVAFEVSKAKLHVHVLPDAVSCEIANEGAAVRQLIKRELRKNQRRGQGPLLVVCEATGSYSRIVIDCAAELGVACHRAHGSRVRAFAKFRGTHAKSDPIDVRVIADYARSSESLQLHEPPRPAQAELRELVGRRTELREVKEAEEARVEHVATKLVASGMRAHIRSLEGMIAKIDRRIAALMEADQQFAQAARLMISVKGVGMGTAAVILAYLPEIGTVSSGTIAALAGLAPYDDDSGRTKGKRHIFGGRAEVRAGLYMPAVVAMRHNAHLRDLAERIKLKGNAFKIAVTAVMRKMLIILNAIVASGKPCQMAAAT